MSRLDNGLTETQNARLIERAIRNNWLADRFPTRATKRELAESIKERGGFDAVTRAMLATHELMESDNAKAKAAGVRLVVMMEARNQADERDGERSKGEQPDTHGTAMDPGRTRLAAIASRLGIGDLVERAAAAGAGTVTGQVVSTESVG